MEYYYSAISLLQGIFPTRGLNPGLPHCRRILYQLSHKGSPRILEWVAYPFSTESSRPVNRTGWGLLNCGCILYQLGYQGNTLFSHKKNEIVPFAATCMDLTVYHTE